MDDYPTWGQRKAWNNDGMDPDWRPIATKETQPEHKAACSECAHRLYLAMESAWPVGRFSLVDEKLPENFTNPNVTIPIDRLKMFNAQYRELAEFVAWACGVPVEKLSRLDMVKHLASKTSTAT